MLKKKFLLTGLVMAAVCCLLSCNGGQDKNLSQVQDENLCSEENVEIEFPLDRTTFVLPQNDSQFGKKLYSVKTICFTDYNSSKLLAKTCNADIYEKGVSIEVDGSKSYFDAEGMDVMPDKESFPLTAMPSDIPGAPWQPAFVDLEEGSSYWVYTSLYNRGDYENRQTLRIEGWCWRVAQNQGYKYHVLELN